MQFDSTTNSGRASIIEAYKIAVSENAGRLSFKSFCDINGIFDYEKILWWCRWGGANMRAAGQRASVNVVCEVAGVDFWLDEIFAGIFP